MLSKKALRNLIFLFILSSGQLYSLSSLDQALIDAMLSEDDKVDVAKNLIEQGANVNAQTEYVGKTPLHFSAIYDDEEMTRMLLSKGASTEIKDQSGKTPLIIASQFGREPIVNILIEHNANVNATDKEGKTALMHASRSGYPNIVRKLLENDADPKLKNKFGATALTMATRTYDPSVEVVRLLLEHGADLNDIEVDKREYLAAELPEPYKGQVYKIIPGTITKEEAKNIAIRLLQEQLEIAQEEANNITEHEILPLLSDYPKQSAMQRIIDMTINRLRAQRASTEEVTADIIKELSDDYHLNLNNVEIFTQETFKNLIEASTEAGPYILAEVITSDNEQKVHNFFDANSLRQYITGGNVLNPLNNLPIEKIKIYRIIDLESDFESTPITEFAFNNYLYLQLSEYADNLLNDLAYWLRDYLTKKSRGLELTESYRKIQEFGKKAIQAFTILKNQELNPRLKDIADRYLNQLEPLTEDNPELYRRVYIDINGNTRTQ